MNDFDYKSLYNDIEPSPWAVGRLRTRIEAMQADPFEDIWRVFRQRIAAGLALAPARAVAAGSAPVDVATRTDHPR